MRQMFFFLIEVIRVDVFDHFFCMILDIHARVERRHPWLDVPKFHQDLHFLLPFLMKIIILGSDASRTGFLVSAAFQEPIFSFKALQHFGVYTFSLSVVQYDFAQSNHLLNRYLAVSWYCLAFYH